MKDRHKDIFDKGGPGAKYNLQGYKPGTKAPSYGMGMRLNGLAPPMITKADKC